MRMGRTMFKGNQIEKMEFGAWEKKENNPLGVFRRWLPPFYHRQSFSLLLFLCPLGSKKNAWIWHVENKGCSIPIIMRPLLDGLQLCYSPLQKPSRIGQKLMHKKMHFMMPFLGVCFSEEEKNNKCIEPALATERFFLLCNAHSNWNWKTGYKDICHALCVSSE